MEDYKARLMEIIDAFIGGRVSFREFRERYYWYYVEEVPEEVAASDEAGFFGLVQERLDTTSENPSEEGRKLGWIDSDEYRLRLARVRALYLSGERELWKQW